MKQIDLVAATPLETEKIRLGLNLLADGPDLWKGTLGETTITLIHTGIGAVNTAWTLASHWASRTPDLAIHFGIAGSFSGEMALGTVVEIVQDSFADLGADSPEGFIGLETMGFPLFVQEKKQWYNSLEQPFPSDWNLQQVAGITVNTVTGTQEGVAVRTALNAQVETMESAAFFYACLRRVIKFVSLRSISNYVEVRNVKAWNLPLSVNAMQQYLIGKLKEIC